jgi:hypothetical protein
LNAPNIRWAVIASSKVVSGTTWKVKPREK